MEAHKEDDNQMGQIICQRTHLNLAKADLWRRSCRRSFRSEWKRLNKYVVGWSNKYILRSTEPSPISPEDPIWVNYPSLYLLNCPPMGYGTSKSKISTRFGQYISFLVPIPSLSQRRNNPLSSLLNLSHPPDDLGPWFYKLVYWSTAIIDVLHQGRELL